METCMFAEYLLWSSDAKPQLEDESIREGRIIILSSDFPVKIFFPHDGGVNTVCCTSDSFSSRLHQKRFGVDSHPIRHPKTSYRAAQMA